ncbi:hypothetical protein [Neptuniibacter sp. QD37_11]|uniref:hypothetical protein n=1 Tax=Neptuniibacter sp. QD37_11 TaxID=3398209 RepID=UPI0039F4F337
MNATIKSLKIVSKHPGVTPGQFAKLYFPSDHEGWQRTARAGRGVCRGGGLRLWAGGWLGKLRKRGLINSHNNITSEGNVLLREYAKELRENEW